MKCLRLERLPRVNLTVDLDDVHILDCAHQDSQKMSVMGYHGGSSENVDAHVYNIHTQMYTHNVYTQIYTCALCTLYTCTNVHIYTHRCIHTNNGHIYANIHRCTHRAHTNIHTQIYINAYICIRCTHIYICTQKHTCTMYTNTFKHIIYYIYA